MSDQTKQWLRDLQNVLDRIPPGHWIFAASGALHLMEYDHDNTRRITATGAMDQDAIVGAAGGPEIDGGGW